MGIVTRARLIVLASITGLFVWVFADALFGSGVFVFRDAGHYYYPLFQFTTSQWRAGRVPLWNPYENLGVPLAGNATSSVFYPGTLIFLLPVDYAWAYKVYVMAHLLLAAGTAYRLARHWRAGVEAAGVAAVSYAFSGNVLFQYCNVVFLVGAAWLPVAVLAADRMLRGRSSRWALALGAVLALMTLGGNAEMAYHAGLLAAMYAVWLWWYGPMARRNESATDNEGQISKSAGKRREKWQVGKPAPRATFFQTSHAFLTTSRPALLAMAAVAGFAFSAIQVIPSVEFTRLSGRAVSSVPRTIYEIPGCQLRKPRHPDEADGRWTDGLTCRRLAAGTHHEHVYHFSVGPWRLAEYVWPNVGGRQFPVHRRWLEVIPGEGRVWVPSFYMGLVPLVLAIAAMRFRRAPPRVTWLSWVVVLAVAAAFGWYGPGWLVEEIRIVAGADRWEARPVGAPFGGLYWLMTAVLPGYIYFRYPGKLLAIAALGLSMLAGVGWARAFAAPSAGLRRGLLWLTGLSLLGAGIAVAIRPFWADWLAGVGPDMLFGPLDVSGAAHDLLAALLQTAAVSALFWWLLGRRARGARWPATAALVLVAVDLGLANGWMVACAPAGQWHEKGKLAAVLKEQEARRGDGRPFRVYRRPIWMPPSWQSTSSPDRLRDAARWDHDTLWPKYNLAPGISLVEVRGTMMPYDYEVYLRVGMRGTVPLCPPANVKYLILRGEDRLPGASPIDLKTAEPHPPEDVSLWQNPRYLPRAWIVHQLDVLPPLESRDPEQIRRRTAQVFWWEGRPRDLRESALVEVGKRRPTLLPPKTVGEKPERHAGTQGTARSSRPEAESCRVVHYDPLRVEIEARLKRPGLVILCDQFYPGWRLDIETAGQGKRRAPILRTNRVMRGVWLGAGDHRLIYRYRPVSFLCGALISSIAWFAATLMFWRARRKIAWVNPPLLRASPP